jgi:methionyl-tRNA formyltransferase
VRFADVLAMRLYNKLFLAAHDRAWLDATVAEMERRFPPLPNSVRVLETHSPNTKAARSFIEEVSPDLILARCKLMLKEKIFSIPRLGTFIMHPGICPEYRNAHGAFWALANDDLERVGMTLLKIDKGVDTGPVYGFYTYDFDEVRESHMVIQLRLVLENLDALREKLLEIDEGRAAVMDTEGRPSAMWGQPWLTRYLRWKRRARRRRDASDSPRVP